MGTFSSLTPLFEKPISESTRSIFGSIIRPPEQQPTTHFTEIFGELHFKESPPLGSRGSSLQLCTEGLGSESSDAPAGELAVVEEGGGGKGRQWCGRPLREPRGFPPPLPSLAGKGKAVVAFEGVKEEGRFVLREVWRAPAQEVFLRARREDGRLRLQLVQSDTLEEEEDDASGEAEGVVGEDKRNVEA